MDIRGLPFDSEGGGGWQIWPGQIINFQRRLGRTIDIQEYKGQNIYNISFQIFWKSKKKKKKKKGGGEGSECW